MFHRVSDLVAVPSVESLLADLKEYHVPHGKFVRIGTLVLTAPSVGTERGGLVSHTDIAVAALEHPNQELRQRAQEAKAEADSAQILQGAAEFGMVDAGQYRLSLTPGRVITAMTIYGLSALFERADKAGRQETCRLTQTLLGPTVTVRTEEF